MWCFLLRVVPAVSAKMTEFSAYLVVVFVVLSVATARNKSPLIDEEHVKTRNKAAGKQWNSFIPRNGENNCLHAQLHRDKKIIEIRNRITFDIDQLLTINFIRTLVI